jgi:flotillin
MRQVIASMAIEETQAQAKVAGAQATLQVKKAEAFELGETRRRVAEAAVAEAENLAQAKAAIAEAKRVEAERRATLEAPAKAEKAKTIVDAEAEGERRKIEAAAEAAAVYVRLEAEARGDFEKLSKKADGLREIVAACGGADETYRLLMLEHLDHLADKAAEAVSNIKFDKVVLWGGAGNGSAGPGVSSFVADVMNSLPPALHTMMNIGGVKFGDGLIEVLQEVEVEGVEAEAGEEPEEDTAAPTAEAAAAEVDDHEVVMVPPDDENDSE